MYRCHHCSSAQILSAPELPEGRGVFLRHLHDRLLGGDDTALEALAEHLLPDLRRRLRRAFRGATEDMVNDAAENAILEYGRSPVRFDASRGVPLDRFLCKAAWRNVADMWDAERRRQARERTYATATAIAHRTPDFHEGALLAKRELLLEIAVTRLLETAVSDAERAALLLFLDGERRTAPLAMTLGLNGLLVCETRREVKRFKDRVLKRIARDVRRSTARK